MSAASFTGSASGVPIGKWPATPFAAGNRLAINVWACALFSVPCRYRAGTPAARSIAIKAEALSSELPASPHKVPRVPRSAP